MELTDIRVKTCHEERLKAFVTLTFDHCFVVRGVRIIRRQGGYLVAMPSRQRRDGTYQDVAHPIHAEMRGRLERRVLDAYRAVLDGHAALAETD